ncbi:MAG TPA: DNA-3-methyladenine glycosylase [Candidatus Acidoferrum sp.]|nr:DNA-3-methyladenine glycosylase [Candidatus Acidoferrum sp.]
MESSHSGTDSSLPLRRAFYERNTVRVAKELLDKVLVRRLGATSLEGLIVETEAYRGYDDAASHAYRGPTRRNEVMFGEPGHAYVYFTYGMHYCLNVTTEPAGQPGAVLIRAAQPIRGIGEMKKRRGTEHVKDLSNGPAKLTQAFYVTKALNGHDLTLGEKLYITEPAHPEPFSISAGTRIGIRAGAEKPWRFSIRGNPFVSKR